jgi:hypothetical protein
MVMAADGALVPTLLIARTVKVYAEVAVRLRMVHVVPAVEHR